MGDSLGFRVKIESFWVSLEVVWGQSGDSMGTVWG
jgi:hypothetical protein